MHRQRLSRGLAAVAVVALVAAGCGDDDDAATDDPGTDARATPASADLDAYCDGVVAIDALPEPEIDFETATPDEMAAAAQEWAASEMKPVVDDLLAVVPDEIADDAHVAAAAVEELAETGDFMSAFENPEVDAAIDRMHQFDLENCGWAQVEVTTTDYAFDGLSDGLPAGVTSIELTNEGDEVHEVVLVRRNEGVDQPVEEILELPEEESLELVTFLGVIGPVESGGEEFLVVDLVPGDYIALCFIPTGMVSMDDFGEDGPPEGPPHFVHDMVTEFTVA